jgi:hypothetical protein
LRPGKTRQDLTGDAAAEFAKLAQALRSRGHDPIKVAYFTNRLVFCMFAEDAGLLPNKMFLRMLQAAKTAPDEFERLASTLFAAMKDGGLVGFERIEWFNGGLFDDDKALPLTADDIDICSGAALLNWSEIDPSIFGTLFVRGLDPDKRSETGSEYTDREKIMKIIEPVITRPLLREWEIVRSGIAAIVEPAHRAVEEAIAGASAFPELSQRCDKSKVDCRRAPNLSFLPSWRSSAACAHSTMCGASCEPPIALCKKRPNTGVRRFKLSWRGCGRFVCSIPHVAPAISCIWRWSNSKTSSGASRSREAIGLSPDLSGHWAGNAARYRA